MTQEEALSNLRLKPTPCLRPVHATADRPAGICRQDSNHEGPCEASLIRGLSFNERALIVAIEDLLGCLAGTEHCDPVHGDSLSVREARNLLTRIREEHRMAGGR